MRGGVISEWSEISCVAYRQNAVKVACISASIVRSEKVVMEFSVSVSIFH